jgi:hypothetical protein
MFNTERPVEDVIIEAEFIEEGAKSFKPGIAGAAQRAAHVLETLADTVEAITPDKANELRGRASTIKNAASSAEVLFDSSKALYEDSKKVGTQVKKLLAQVGIEPELVRRPRGGRRGES